jgi:hypothetical protein
VTVNWSLFEVLFEEDGSKSTSNMKVTACQMVAFESDFLAVTGHVDLTFQIHILWCI